MVKLILKRVALAHISMVPVLAVQEVKKISLLPERLIYLQY